MRQLFTAILQIIIFFPSIAQTWQPLTIPTNRNIVSSSFINNEEGWIGTESSSGAALLYHTADGGANWNSITIATAIGSSYITFLNAFLGYAVADSGLYKTTDGGLNWSVIILPGPAFNEPFFLSEDTGYVCGAGTLYKTTDGGLTWSDYQYAAPYFHITKLDFYDEQHGASVDNANFLYATSDGGVTWEVLSDGGLWCINSGVTHLPNGELISSTYCEEFSNYSVSTSGPGPGYYSDEYQKILDVRSIDANRTYAVLSEGVVAYTNDSGITWNEDYLGNVSLNIVDGTGAVYVFGENGKGFMLDASACYTTSAFSYSIDNVEVTFTDLSVNATTWQWDFGDGTTSTDQNPVHLYSDDGDFTVCLNTGDSVCGADYLCEELLLCAANTSSSTAGTLDLTFDGDGIVTTLAPSYSQQVQTLLIQPDGKVIATGTGTDAAIVRYNTDGSLDTTFGGDGIVSGLFPDITVGKAALTDDGKILVGAPITLISWPFTG